MRTYQLYEVLKSIDGVTEEQVREAIDEITYSNGVATKEDLNDLRTATKEDLNDLELKMVSKEHLDAQISALKFQIVRHVSILMATGVSVLSLLIIILRFFV